MSDRAPDHDAGAPPEEWLIGAPRHRPDRWAHRRGEPRGLALVWSCYLLGACAVTLFGPASSLSFDAMQIRASSTLLVALVLLGIVLVWPMLRLSQVPPRSPVGATLVDLLIVLTPSLAVVGSTSILTRWAWSTSGAMVTLLCAWTLLLAGSLAVATRWTGTLARAGSMLAIVAIVTAAPFATLLSAWHAGASGAPLGAEAWRAGLLLSPISAPYAIASHPARSTPAPDALAWRAALVPLAPAAALWALAGALDLLTLARRPGRTAREARGYT